MPGKDPGGLLMTMLLGVAGSIVAGLLGQRARHLPRGRRGAGHHRVHHRRRDPAGRLSRHRRPPGELTWPTRAGQRAGAGTRARRPAHPPADAHGGEGPAHAGRGVGRPSPVAAVRAAADLAVARGRAASGGDARSSGAGSGGARSSALMTLVMCGVAALLITVVFTSLAEQLSKLVQDFPALRDRVDQRLPAHYPTLKRIVRRDLRAAVVARGGGAAQAAAGARAPSRCRAWCRCSSR